jgi:hypothetical protein
MDKYFMARIKRTNGTVEKGLEVKDSFDAAKQSYHAYLGAYAYEHDANTDYVACYIVDSYGNRLMWEVWDNTQQPEEEEPQEG